MEQGQQQRAGHVAGPLQGGEGDGPTAVESGGGADILCDPVQHLLTEPVAEGYVRVPERAGLGVGLHERVTDPS
jgi:hypothetical protein